MDLLPSPEQQQIIDSTAAFAADRLPLRRLHGKDGAPDAVSPERWREIAEMGWLAMALGEAEGGIGYGEPEEVLVFWQLGRELAPPRIMFTAIAARVAAKSGDAALAAALAQGEQIVALAVQDDFAGSADALGRRRLFEYKQATLALVADGDRVRLLSLAGSDCEARPHLDASVSMALADLSDCEVLCEVRDPGIADAGSLLCSAMLIGLAETATEMIVEYAKIRVTFGRPIGAYQAVRHPCADMAARCEQARAQLFMAAAAMNDGRADAGLLVSAARLLAEEAALSNCDSTIQLHGGIGVTDEFDTHLLLKRANAMKSWFGHRQADVARILARPVDPASAGLPAAAAAE